MFFFLCVCVFFGFYFVPYSFLFLQYMQCEIKIYVLLICDFFFHVEKSSVNRDSNPGHLADRAITRTTAPNLSTERHALFISPLYKNSFPISKSIKYGFWHLSNPHLQCIYFNVREYPESYSNLEWPFDLEVNFKLICNVLCFISH